MADDSDRNAEFDDDELDATGNDERDNVEEEAEEQAPLEPDHQDAIAALKDCGCRLDVDDTGHVWRIFLYDRMGDETLAQIHGLPALKDVWVIGTRVSKEMVEQFKEQFPKVRVYG